MKKSDEIFARIVDKVLLTILSFNYKAIQPHAPLNNVSQWGVFWVMVLRILYYSKNKIQALMGEIKKIKCEGNSLKKPQMKNKC